MQLTVKSILFNFANRPGQVHQTLSQGKSKEGRTSNIPSLSLHIHFFTACMPCFFQETVLNTVPIKFYQYKWHFALRKLVLQSGLAICSVLKSTEYPILKLDTGHHKLSIHWNILNKFLSSTDRVFFCCL